MLELVARFLVIGALAFGGGQAALPLVERLAVADTGWLTPAQFATGVGLSCATPGPVLILAAFIGYHVAAVPGAVAATAAVFTIPVVLAGFTAQVVAKLKDTRWFQAFGQFAAARPSACSVLRCSRLRGRWWMFIGPYCWGRRSYSPPSCAV